MAGNMFCIVYITVYNSLTILKLLNEMIDLTSVYLLGLHAPEGNIILYIILYIIRSFLFMHALYLQKSSLQNSNRIAKRSIGAAQRYWGPVANFSLMAPIPQQKRHENCVTSS